MSKLFYNALKIVAGLFFVSIFLSYSSNPPDGRTGAPGDGVCSSCHVGNNFEGNVSIKNMPSTVISGESYMLSVVIKNTDAKAVRAGFQSVSLFDNDFENAGNYIASSTDLGISEAGGRQYVEHRGAKNFQDSVATWIFEWKAPIVEEEKEVIMFTAANIANGGSSSGDAIKFNEFELTVQPPLAAELDVSIEVVDILCEGELGSLEANVEGGTTPFEYLWSNGVTSKLNADLLAGFYSVTVTDANDSMSISEVLLIEPDPLVFDFIVSDESIEGASDGSITAMVTGGLSPYSYLWSNGVTSNENQNLSAGEHSVTVTDANGCMNSISVNVEFAECAFEINLNVNQITCVGAEDGEATIDPANFEQPITFEWSTGESLFIAVAGLSAGEYNVTVTDGTGCSIVESFSIIDPLPLSVSLLPRMDCEDFTTNSLSANVTGGTKDYEYMWSNGSSEDVITNIDEGTYTLTVTDAGGCSVTDEILFEHKDLESPVISYKDSVDLYVDGAGEIDFSPLALSETDNCGIESVLLSGELACTDLTSRTLIYEVTDVNNNVSSVLIYINSIIDTIPPSTIGLDDILLDGCDTVFYELPELMDNCGIDTIELLEGCASGSIFPKDSTKVTYNFYDYAGNLGSFSFWVVAKNDLTLEIDEVKDANPDNGGAISITINGGSGNYLYEWTLDNSTIISSFEDISNLEPGSYRVKVIDKEGCLIVSDVIEVNLGSNSNEISTHDVEFFPNPVYSSYSVNFTGNLTSARVINFNGQSIKETISKPGETQLNFEAESLVPGIYFLQLKFDTGIKTIKFVKQ